MAYWNATINQHSFIFVMICGRKEKTTKYAFKYLINNLCIQFSLSLISFKSCQICLFCPRKNVKGMFNFIISKLVFDTCTNWSEIVDVKQNFIFTTYWRKFKGIVIIIFCIYHSFQACTGLQWNSSHQGWIQRHKTFRLQGKILGLLLLSSWLVSK